MPKRRACADLQPSVTDGMGEKRFGLDTFPKLRGGSDVPHGLDFPGRLRLGVGQPMLTCDLSKAT